MNLPYNYQPIVSKDLFKSAITSKFPANEYSDTIDLFFEVASNFWKHLVNPTMNDLRNMMLEIVAHVKAREIRKRINLQDVPLVAQTLYEVIAYLVQEKKELVSETGFINITKIRLGQKWYECNLTDECEIDFREYYNFGKKFILYDFPISNFRNNIIKAFFIYLRDVLTRVRTYISKVYDQKTRAVLYMIEDHLDRIYYASYNKFRQDLQNETFQMLEYKEFDEENNKEKPKKYVLENVFEKTDNISNLMSEYASFSFQSNRFVQRFDRFFGISNKIVASEIVTDWFYQKIIELIYNNPLTKLVTKKKEALDQSLVILIEKKNSFGLKSINFKALKDFIKGSFGFMICYFYETPKYYIITINKFCFISSPLFVKRILFEVLKSIFKVKVKEMKTQGEILYKEAINRIKESKGIIQKSVSDFNEKINERKKLEYPILAKN